MKILVITTGGTIASTQVENHINLSENNLNIINLFNEKYENNCVFDVMSPHSILSENETFSHIKAVFNAVKKGEIKNIYDGIIITHGTDTLPFFAPAMSYILGEITLPVVIVSSNKVLTDSTSNGLSNFFGAVKFISTKTNGVFVSYQNKGEKIKIFDAKKILAHMAFSDEIKSADNSFLCEIDEKTNSLTKNEIIFNAFKPDKTFNFSHQNQPVFSDKIVYLSSFLGLGASLNQLNFSNINAVILSTFHSGTLPTDDVNFVLFCKKCKALSVKIFAVGGTKDVTYASSDEFSRLNITPILDESPSAVYIKACLLDAENQLENLK